MNLLEGKLPISDEHDLGLVTHPYPAWDKKAKETLDRIPTAGQRERSTISAAATGETEVLPEVQVDATVTREQPSVSNPASPAASPQTTAPVEQPAPPAPIVPAAAVRKAAVPATDITSALARATGGAIAAAALNTTLTPAPLPASAAVAETSPALVHPTRQQPLAVTGAEQAPVSSPAATGDKKNEPTSAERLSALIKQRSEFLTALKAEVSRRRNSTEDEEELVRLEKELRLVQLAGEQPEEAVREIESLDVVEKDAFAHLLMGLATWMNADEARRPTFRNAKIVREIRDAAAELAAASKLDVRNLAFCEKVESYGWYTEFAKSQFKPKQEVLLYAEVENFTAVRIADETYETELQGSYQIFDSQSKLVDDRELPLDLEQCRNYRKDYFLAYRIYLPDSLSPGKYRLELSIEDKKGSAIRHEPVTRGPLPETQRRNEKEDKLGKLAVPSSASSYKGRKLGTGTIEFTIK